MRPIGQCEGRGSKVSILHRTSNAVARSNVSIHSPCKHRADRERTLLYVTYIIAGQIKSPRATDKHARVLHATVVVVIAAVVVVYRAKMRIVP